VSVLVTFTGSHDPFSSGAQSGDASAGPVLAAVAELKPTEVYLLTTPRMAERSDETAKAIKERHATIRVHMLDVPLKDPTNYIGILRQIRRHFLGISRTHAGSRFFVQISSGTPQMHACWLLLVASGEIPATIIQTIPPEFIPEGSSCVREIDLQKADFPHVSLRFDGAEHSGEDDLSRISAELGIIGSDPAFLSPLGEAATYAEYDEIHVLLMGETGTGKELFTKLIHRMSSRSSRALVTVNCSSIPSELVESQLFGHRKGAFTGAISDNEGKFKAADGGILFLDELGELSLSAQAKLLRALEHGEIETVGSSKISKVNVRVVAATNRDLRKMVSEGAFREDLYQRFGATVSLPSLRQRRADIAPLANHILQEWNQRHKKQRSLSAKALAALAGQHWHGNIRELRRVIQQSVMLSERNALTEKELRFELPLAADPSTALPEPEIGFKINAYLDRTKAKIVDRALDKVGGVQAAAARLLGWTPQALSQYLKSIKHHG
jgi:transcriptional regulator with GAF, ATPase, and Fis domain